MWGLGNGSEARQSQILKQGPERSDLQATAESINAVDLPWTLESTFRPIGLINNRTEDASQVRQGASLRQQMEGWPGHNREEAPLRGGNETRRRE